MSTMNGLFVAMLLWMVHKRDRVDLYRDRWIPNMEPFRTIINGPLNRGEKSLSMASILL